MVKEESQLLFRDLLPEFECQDLTPAGTDVTAIAGRKLLRTYTSRIMKPISRSALQQFAQCGRGCISQSPRRLGSIELFRNFGCSPSHCTDGVFKELTAMRVRTPWVEALRQQQSKEKNPTESPNKTEVRKNRNLEPKHMNDSYHSVVLPLARDPWLLDTYLNSSGHIRLGTIFMDLDALSGIIACTSERSRDL